MGKKEAINIARKFSIKAVNVIDAEQIILFGSFARGTNHLYSDIDIALVMKNNKYDFFETYAKLSEICRGIDTRIEPIILEKDKDFSGFLEMIYKEGIVVYNSA
ncbi:MAG: nucleotidyltransferase domain-containing protein [Ignavibacteriae bacterium]|nr:nucleotidyltransferase domain-containing protein [Ignavibacteriota bacterium]